RAVATITGTRLTARSMCNRSMPSMSGSPRSRTTTSGWRSTISDNPDKPSLDVRTSWPRSASARLSATRMRGSSSTTVTATMAATDDTAGQVRRLPEALEDLQRTRFDDHPLACLHLVTLGEGVRGVDDPEPSPPPSDPRDRERQRLVVRVEEEEKGVVLDRL